MGVSENSGTPKSSILIGISIINHPFWGTPIFGNAYMSLISRLNISWTKSPPLKKIDTKNLALENVSQASNMASFFGIYVNPFHSWDRYIHLPIYHIFHQ